MVNVLECPLGRRQFNSLRALRDRETKYEQGEEKRRLLFELWQEFGELGGRAFTNQPHPSEFRGGYGRSRQVLASLENIGFENDGSLFSLASSDGRIEIHEFEAVLMGCESRRVSLDTGLKSCIIGCQFNTSKTNELILGFQRKAGIWFFDLETCRSTRPTKEVATGSPTSALSSFSGDLLIHGGANGVLKLFDMRSTAREAQLVWDLGKEYQNPSITAVSPADCFGSSLICATHSVRSEHPSAAYCFDLRGASSSSSSDPVFLKKLFLGDSRVDTLRFIEGSATDVAVIFNNGRSSILDMQKYSLKDLLDRPAVDASASRRGVKRKLTQNAMISRSTEVTASHPLSILQQYTVGFSSRRQCSLRRIGSLMALLTDSRLPGRLDVFDTRSRHLVSGIKCTAQERISGIACHPTLPYSVVGFSNNTVEVLSHMPKVSEAESEAA
ncbi:hypothetical protein NDN08_007812 [Rhodosorus marinus]|uniref:Uncharacterized protein n=1 Tax=Rhodosorus marinus TaxID=101924 RepID=A0AAV8V3Z2_9RHOD|nr:hypothetical protein NDN08_007812 [Rhodosorus marinus]